MRIKVYPDGGVGNIVRTFSSDTIKNIVCYAPLEEQNQMR